LLYTILILITEKRNYLFRCSHSAWLL